MTFPNNVVDSFTRANGAIGSTDGGSLSPLAWQLSTGAVWNIASNCAVQTHNDAYDLAWVELDQVCHEAHVQLKSINGEMGVAVGVVDEGRFYAAIVTSPTNVDLVEYNAGVPTVLHSYTYAVNDNDQIGLEVYGTQYTVVINTVVRLSPVVLAGSSSGALGAGIITRAASTGTFAGFGATDLYTDSVLFSEDASGPPPSYALTLAGTGTILVSDVEEELGFGQQWVGAGTQYHISQVFLDIDTSGYSVAPAAAVLQLTVNSNQADPSIDPPHDQAFTIKVAVFDWGGGKVTNPHWRTPTQLNALTVIGSKSTVGITDGQTILIPIDPAAIVLNGRTRLILFSDRNAASIPPSTDPSTYVSEQVIVATSGDPVLAKKPAIVNAPAVSTVDRVSATTKGGQVVNITGTDMAYATEVLFGDVSGTNFVNQGATQCQATTPAHDPGPVAVTVQ